MTSIRRRILARLAITNGHASPPFEHYGPLQSEEAIQHAGAIVEFVRLQMAGRRDGGLRAARMGGARSPREPRRPPDRLLRLVRPRRLGVGSDVDVVIVVAASDEPFERRALRWDVTELPVPADVLVYTEHEWESLPQQGRFGACLHAKRSGFTGAGTEAPPADRISFGFAAPDRRSARAGGPRALSARPDCARALRGSSARRRWSAPCGEAPR